MNEQGMTFEYMNINRLNLSNFKHILN